MNNENIQQYPTYPQKSSSKWCNINNQYIMYQKMALSVQNCLKFSRRTPKLAAQISGSAGATTQPQHQCKEACLGVWKSSTIGRHLENILKTNEEVSLPHLCRHNCCTNCDMCMLFYYIRFGWLDGICYHGNWLCLEDVNFTPADELWCISFNQL